MQDYPSQSQVGEFKHASLELDPEKEFENAKWIVLTTSQPYLADTDKDNQMDYDVAEKRDAKASGKDQGWSSY